MDQVAWTRSPGVISVDRSVKIRIPAKVAYDLDAFSGVVADRAGRIGCRPCLSGADCWFSLERDFVVNPATRELETAVGDVIQG